MLTFNLPLKWKDSIKLALGVRDTHAVVVGGKVYIGGGEAEGSDYKMLEYTIKEGQWREIKTPVQYFSMSVVKNQVIIIGGRDEEAEVTNQVWVLDSLSDTWIQPFPPLPGARYLTSAMSYKEWVLVMGGEDDNCINCSDLYLLDTTHKVWNTASPLPWRTVQPSLTVMQDTLYVVCGNSAVSISIPALISDAVSQHPASDTTTDTSDGPKPTEWQPLPDTPTRDPALVVFRNLLLAVGAYYDSPSSTIALYWPQTKQWLTVAQLPTPRKACICVTLPDTEELMVIGGVDDDCKFIKTIDLCTL